MFISDAVAVGVCCSHGDGTWDGVDEGRLDKEAEHDLSVLDLGDEDVAVLLDVGRKHTAHAHLFALLVALDSLEFWLLALELATCCCHYSRVRLLHGQGWKLLGRENIGIFELGRDVEHDCLVASRNLDHVRLDLELDRAHSFGELSTIFARALDGGGTNGGGNGQEIVLNFDVVVA